MTLLLALAGCQAGDPHSDDLFRGIAGITGGYQTQINQQQQQLTTTRNEAAREGVEYNRLSAIAGQRAETVEQLHAQLDALQGQAEILHRRIAELSATRSDMSSQIAAAEHRRDEIATEIERVKAEGGSLPELRRREKELNDEIARLREVLDAIGSR